MKNFGKRFLNQTQNFVKNGNKAVLSKNLVRNYFQKKNFTLYAFTAMGFSLSTYHIMNQNINLDGFYEITIDDDFTEGETRAVQVGPKEDDKVLVSKKDGQFYCVSNACTHFGFGLDKGVQFGDKVTCPLHMAQFSVKTGEHQYGPVFKGLETFEVTAKDGKIHLKVSKDKLNKGKTLPMSKQGDDPRRFLIIGGGVAGLSAAETLRQSGFEGQITILSNEKDAPYDRTMLSKFFGAQMKGIQVRSEDFLKEFDINLIKGTNVDQIDTSKNFIQTTDGKHLHYEKLLIATGATPRVPPIPNVKADGVVTMRNYSDLEELRKHATGAKNVVIAGAGFIGLESASSIQAHLKDQKVNVTVCDVAEVPLARVLGPEVGSGLQKFHEENGVKFQMQTSINKINVGENGKVSSVTLSNGQSIDADLVIVGTGVTPNTKFVPSTFQLAKDGGIETDIFQRVKNQSNVFAAGDVANYPWWYTGQNVRIEHYNEAIHQGYIAALNMLGKTVPNDNVPFFWTRFHNKSLAYTGHAQQYDEIHIEGSLKEQKFLAYYFWNNQVVAAASMGMMNATMIIQEAMKQNVLPKANDIKSGRMNLQDIQAKVAAKGHNCKCRKRGGCGGNKQAQQQ